MLHLSVPDHSKDNSGTAKQAVDVYEFMDNEDTDMFDFRSKRLDRFKNTNKDLGHCSKTDPVINKDYENSQHSSISGSDVDDFVYMSDDYVCSADETENSLLSCELGTVSKSSNEGKKNGSSIKRKDSTEKNAVMGKIFKHNAMRNERKNYSKAKEVKCAKANLDQLFDSLLENEPNSSLVLNESIGSKKDAPEPMSSSVSEILSLPAIDEIASEAGPSREVVEEEEREAGVARQRARRKCTVGKQNVLAESWSSESEGDSGESEGAGHRRRAARPQGPSRRARRITFKADENESRVCSNVSTSSGRRDKRSRSELAYYWSSTEEEDTRVEQHGWIVGDSHKKLVTMLAHAKGRKRDDRRHFVE
ncbi:hypothetical protein EVAR_68044_1 [Eumeta japonica]|uniref:Uncharacterized protein n=1 Tax=Eumeta variegata TaxID=151549 RepID=A0A4C1ZVZ0_EUMVA|nr:hypothetical protein EVAR_68044_1 [Eumeta japonica]